MTDAPYGGLTATGRPLGEVPPEGQTSPSEQSGSTSETAKAQAGQVGQTAKDSGQRVVGTATEQGKHVVDEGRKQVRNLGREVGQQVNEQTSAQKDRASAGLRSLADELSTMASSGMQSGIATDLAQQAASRAQELASWLDQRDPGSILEEVRGLARRKPGTFLLGALAAGVVAGRLTRGAVDARQSDQGPETQVQPMPVTRTGSDYTLGAAPGSDVTVGVPAGEPVAAPGEYGGASGGDYR